MGSNTVSGNMFGAMEILMRVIGRITKWKELVFSNMWGIFLSKATLRTIISIWEGMFTSILSKPESK